MKNKLIKIQTSNLYLAWKEAAPYLASSLQLTPEYTLEDIYNLLRDGILTLWMFYNEENKRAFGAMVTELVEHPQKIILVIFLMGTDNFEDVEPLFEQLLQYARESGASSIECYGRFGLEKLLDNLGFKKSYIVMHYDVN